MGDMKVSYPKAEATGNRQQAIVGKKRSREK
jgi:hypothetical protein